MDLFAQDVRFAVRSLRRNRGLALGVTVTLALAIGAGTAIFALVQAALLSPPPFADADRIAVVYTTHTEPGEGTRRLRWSYPRFRMLERELSTAEHVGAYGLASVNLSGGELAEPVNAEVVGGGYFAALGVRPARGRLFSAEEDRSSDAPPVALIAHDLWVRRYLADPAVVGRTIRVNGGELTVIGILPAGFAGLTGRAELWFPQILAPRLTYPAYLTTNQHFISVVAKLRPGASFEALDAELELLGARIQRALPSESETPGDAFGADAAPLTEVRIDPTARRISLVLFGAVGIVVLLACANVSCLLLAHTAARRREMAVRAALGANRGRLVRQLLTETLVLAALGGVAGVALAWWGTRVVALPASAISPANMYGSIGELVRPHPDGVVIAFAAGLTMLTAVVSGLVPALQAARADLSTTLKEGGAVTRRGLSRRLSLRGLAVAAEVALALVLLTGGALMLATLARLAGDRIGVDPRGVLVFSIRPPDVRYPPSEAPAFIERLLARVEETPGVVAATVDGCAPIATSCARSTVHFAGRPAPAPGNEPPVMRHYVAPDHFATLGIPVLRGRGLTADDRAGRPGVAVINETAARRFWPDGDPIGERIWFGASAFTSADSAVEIVGVVGDVPYQVGEERREMPAVYTSYLQFTYASRTVMVRTRGDPAALVGAVRSAVRAVDPDLALYEIAPLTETIGDAWARHRFTTAVLVAFAGLALVLAGTGVFGVVAQTVGERTREIGIRMALGATTNAVWRMIVRDGMALPLIGLAVGLALSFGAGQALRGLLYGVRATEPAVLAGAVGFLLLLALAGTVIPARRATQVDPRIALRDE